MNMNTNMNATAYSFLSWQRPAVPLINEYEFVDPVYPLHIPTDNFPTVSLDQLTVILPLECCIIMFINFCIARPKYCFILCTPAV